MSGGGGSLGQRQLLVASAGGSYPLTAEVYAVVRGDAPAGSGAVLLRDWLLTGAGRAAIAASGYVPTP